MAAQRARLLVAEHDFDAFTTRLASEVHSRGEPTYALLLSILLDLNQALPLRLEKLFVAFTGRTIATSADDGGEMPFVWLRGSLDTNDASISRLHQVFNAIDGAGGLWATYTHCVNAWKSCHAYLALHNRHGHGQDKPSFAALGFASVEDMQRAVTSERWAQYVAEHTACCGLGLKARRRTGRSR